MNVVYAEAAAAFEGLTLEARKMISPGKAKMRSPTSSARRAFFRRLIRAGRPLRYQMMLALNGVFTKTDAMLGPFDTGPMPIASSLPRIPVFASTQGS